MSEVATDGEDYDKLKRERAFFADVLQEILDRTKCSHLNADAQLSYVDGLASSALCKVFIVNDPASPFYGMTKKDNDE